PQRCGSDSRQFDVDRHRVVRQETDAFDIGADGTQSHRQVWAELGSGVPDGIWFNETLTALERKLDPHHFLRVHRGHLVNLTKVVRAGRVRRTLVSPGSEDSGSTHDS